MKSQKYPIPYGFKVEAEIVRDDETDTAEIVIHAPMYKNKEFKTTYSFKASHFSDSQILRDHTFTTDMLNRFGGQNE